MLEGQTCSKAYQYGMIPVTEIYRELILLYISFADAKQTSYAEAVSKIKSIIFEMYSQYERMIDKDALTDSQRQLLSTIKVGMDDIAAQNSLKILSSVLAVH